MTVKIYGVPGSRTRRVFWMAEECGVPYETVKIGFDASMKTPEYGAINPNLRIPGFEDGDLKLFESLAINLYLAKKYGGELYPKDEKEEALVFQWTLFGNADLDNQAGAWGAAAVATPPEKRDPKVIAEALAKMEKPLGILDAALAGKDYLVGGKFTAADLNIASICYRLIFMEGESRWPNFQAWLKRCWARPAALKVRKMMEG